MFTFKTVLAPIRSAFWLLLSLIILEILSSVSAPMLFFAFLFVPWFWIIYHNVHNLYTVARFLLVVLIPFISFWLHLLPIVIYTFLICCFVLFFVSNLFSQWPHLNWPPLFTFVQPFICNVVLICSFILLFVLKLFSQCPHLNWPPLLTFVPPFIWNVALICLFTMLSISNLFSQCPHLFHILSG